MAQSSPTIADTTSPEELCASETVWKEHNSSYWCLYILCLGQEVKHPTSGTSAPLLDPSSSPWNTLKRKDLMPKNTQLILEVERRAELFTLNPKPRPKQWKQPILLNWLIENPITATVDCDFLTQTVKKKETLINNAIAESITDETNGEATKRGWSGEIPYLRLIHCIIDDTIKAKFLRRNHAKTRQEIDARNSPMRESTVYEDIAYLWNSDDFNPQSFLTTCHESFTEHKDLSYSAINEFARANPRKVQDRISHMRKELLEIIKNWEASGQGDGGRISGYESESDVVAGDTVGFGELKNRPSCALDTRSAFLQSKPPYLLYFWELADEQGLLSSTLQRLDDSVGLADGGSSVSLFSSTTTTGSSSKKGKSKSDDDDDCVDAMKDLSRSIVLAAKVQSASENRKRINELKDAGRNIRMKIFDNSNNLDFKQFLEAELEEINDEIKCLKEDNERYDDEINTYKN
jgi:hypothetical protein